MTFHPSTQEKIPHIFINSQFQRARPFPDGKRAHREWQMQSYISTAGEIEYDEDGAKSAAAQLGSSGGKKRGANLTPERRKEIAQKAAAKE